MSNIKTTEIILNLAKERGGIVTASDVTYNSIPRRVLSEMVNDNVLVKADRGVYLLPDAWEDEWFFTQYRYTKGIYSHETALFLHGYSDRTPASLEMTFPRGYHRQSQSKVPIIERYAVKDLYQIGIISVSSPAGYPIRAYNLERSLCDILRGNKNFDIETANKAMRRYVKDRNKDLYKLMEYAKLFKVEKKVRNYVEVLL